ncbi:glycosyl hydrolase family 5 [Loktanella sp. SALINAS62]|nr:glycosyl hydrolase family 5 [Loktanella sp. SALINAS62]
MHGRRDFIKALSATGLLLTGRAQARPAQDAWRMWKDLYLQGGRVIDHDQGRISHSEGQGYGLLLAQAHGDEVTFRSIENWTKQHLAIRQDRLMAWKWEPSKENNITDWQNATDGDLFRAWALLRAARDSGWHDFGEVAVSIAHDIADLCLAPDPRAPGELLLIPGAEARRDDDRVLINPSYFMSRALRELGVAADEPRLIRAADHGETVLAELATTGFLPNWVDVTPTGFAEPMEHDTLWGYDALRIPLYLVWSGQKNHPAVALAQTLLGGGDIPDHLVVEAISEGAPRAQSNHPGYRAIRDFAACSSPLDLSSGDPQSDYYPDTLLLLVEVAMRETDCPRQDQP